MLEIAIGILSIALLAISAALFLLSFCLWDWIKQTEISRRDRKAPNPRNDIIN